MEGDIIESFTGLSNEIGIWVGVIGEKYTSGTCCASVIEGGVWYNYRFIITERAGIFWIFKEVV